MTNTVTASALYKPLKYSVTCYLFPHLALSQLRSLSLQPELIRIITYYFQLGKHSVEQIAECSEQIKIASLPNWLRAVCMRLPLLHLQL